MNERTEAVRYYVQMQWRGKWAWLSSSVETEEMARLELERQRRNWPSSPLRIVKNTFIEEVIE